MLSLRVADVAVKKFFLNRRAQLEHANAKFSTDDGIVTLTGVVLLPGEPNRLCQAKVTIELEKVDQRNSVARRVSVESLTPNDGVYRPRTTYKCESESPRYDPLDLGDLLPCMRTLIY